MPDLTVNSRRLSYRTEGEGFPLILVPADRGAMADWARPMPLLGEMCRAITYEYCEPKPAITMPGSTCLNLLVEDLATLLDALAVECTYLAGHASAGQTALHFALRYPKRLEGLLLIDPDGALPAAPLHQMTVPTCVLVGADASTHLAWATRLAAQLPRCAMSIVPGSRASLHGEQPLALGHAMIDFLIQCERQRNLVRGASFLL